MRLINTFATIALLKEVIASGNPCADLSIPEGGFVCSGANQFTYCSGGAPSSFGIQTCQTGLECCQSSKSCGYVGSCPVVTAPYTAAPPGTVHPYASQSPVSSNGAMSSTPAPLPFASSGSMAPAPIATPRPVEVYVPTLPPSTPVYQLQPDTVYTPPTNYVPPPTVVVPVVPRSYHSWKHHTHSYKPTPSHTKTHKKYPHRHVHHYKSHRHSAKSYNHHYRTKTTSPTPSPGTISKITYSKTKGIDHVWHGDNHGLDAVGMQIGAIQGEHRADPWDQIIGPDPTVGGPNAIWPTDTNVP